MAKHLDEFLAWLLSRRRQADLPGGGRSFRRRCEPLWQLWPFSPIVDEVHDVIFVDGIHLGRGAGSSPVEWCNRFVSFGLGYALSWSGVSSCPVGWGVSRDLVRMSRLR